jgi:hypothetical protein
MAFWEYRMRGGVDDVIQRDFGPITEAAARANWTIGRKRRAGGLRC